MLNSKRRNAMAQNLRNYMTKQNQTRLLAESKLVAEIESEQFEDRLKAYLVYTLLACMVIFWIMSFQRIYRIYERDSKFSYFTVVLMVVMTFFYKYALNEIKFTLKKRHYAYIVLAVIFFSPLTTLKYVLS